MHAVSLNSLLEVCPQKVSIVSQSSVYNSTAGTGTAQQQNDISEAKCMVELYNT
jgi:type III secretory pathway lipoprotein EscJ